MIDIAPLYRKAREPKQPLTKFFRSSGFFAARDYLLASGLAEEAILQRNKPCKMQPSVIQVHPLVAAEFLRWLQYESFAKYVMRLQGEGHE